MSDQPNANALPTMPTAEDLDRGLAAISLAAAASDPKARVKALFAKSLDNTITAEESSELAKSFGGSAGPIAAAGVLGPTDALSKAQVEAAALGLNSLAKQLTDGFQALAGQLEKADLRRSDLVVTMAQSTIMMGRMLKGVVEQVNALSKAFTTASPALQPSGGGQPRGVLPGGQPSGLTPIQPPVGQPGAGQGNGQPDPTGGLNKGQIVKGLELLARDFAHGVGPDGTNYGDLGINAHVTGDVPASVIPEIKKRLGLAAAS